MLIQWEKLYYKLIDSRKILSHISENHHIIPKHAGGNDNQSNLVPLIHYDHTLAHYIRYKWKGEIGDLIAYKMMLGLSINPMRDPFILAKHKEIMLQVMNDPGMILHLSNKAKERFNDPKERQKVSEHRKRYINTLNDPAYAARFIMSPESRRKSLEGRLKFNADNPDLIKYRMHKLHCNTIEKNKSLSTEELQVKYSRGSSNNNPNWQGYCYLIKDDVIHKFNTRTEFANVCDLHACTILEYIRNKKPLKRGEWKDFRIVISKDEDICAIIH